MQSSSHDNKPATAAAAANRRSSKSESKRSATTCLPPARTSRYMPSIYSLYGTQLPAPREVPETSTTLASTSQEQQMPYYVVPVLYVPKRIVPTDEFNTSQVDDTLRPSRRSEPTPPPPERFHPASAPGRLQMRGEHSHPRALRHLPSASPSTRTSIYYVNKRMRSSTFALDPNLGKVTEETEQERAAEVVVPTRDVAEAPKESKKKASRVRDETVHEVRRRLLEALEMVEMFEKEKKEMKSTGTQCESPEGTGATSRPFNNVSRLEASLKKMRKHR